MLDRGSNHYAKSLGLLFYLAAWLDTLTGNSYQLLSSLLSRNTSLQKIKRFECGIDKVREK